MTNSMAQQEMTFSWAIPATMSSVEVDGRDILMGGQGNDNIDGGSGKDYLLLDGSMQDYTIAVTRRGVTITNSVR